MSAHIELPPRSALTARPGRGPGDLGRRPCSPLLVAVLLFDDGGQVAETVSPFRSMAAAQSWADVKGLAPGCYRVVPNRLPDRPR